MDESQGKHSLFILIGSILFVLLGMVFVTILGNTRGNSPQDIRARAAQDPSLQFHAVVSSVNIQKNQITIDSLQFADAEEGQKTLGAWTVTPPAEFDPTSVYPGARVTLTVVPSSFNASTKTLTATKIEAK